MLQWKMPLEPGNKRQGNRHNFRSLLNTLDLTYFDKVKVYSRGSPYCILFSIIIALFHNLLPFHNFLQHISMGVKVQRQQDDIVSCHES